MFELPVPRRACAKKVESMKTGHGVYLQGGGRTADCGEILLSDAVWEYYACTVDGRCVS